MIEARELRIGNIVQNLEGEYLHVKSICQNSHGFTGYYIEHKYGETSLEHGSIIPVPLSPELISKCGQRLENHSYITKWTNTGRLEIRIGTSYINALSYLHEYQNFFRFVVGEELTINLNQ